MAIPIITSIILPGTCLIRGSGPNDVNPKRWLAYYGLEKDVKKFCESKAFVEKYARPGYEYYQVLKPLPLLSMPYLSLYLYKDSDAVVAINNSIGMLDFLDWLKDSNQNSYALKKYSYARIRNDILDILVPELEGDYKEVSDPRAKELYKIKQTQKKSSHNPDHSVAAFLCEMGILGWLRKGSMDSYNVGDEIFICNIEKLEREGYLEQRKECNLADC